ncbi:MAG: hypothetical protein LIP08_00080 [Bacteroides sp.]|nr:hypothetical protein [Bacteroides sp.]
MTEDMNLLKDLIMITILVVFIIDLSGAILSMKMCIWRVLKGTATYRPISLKPLDCSLCSTWWACIIFLILTSQLSVKTLMYAALLAFYAENIGYILIAVKDIVGAAVDKITHKIV